MGKDTMPEVNTLRQEFLESRWQSYPVVENAVSVHLAQGLDGQWIGGEIDSMAVDGQSIILRAQGKTQTFDSTGASLVVIDGGTVETASLDWQRVLIPGDKVAVRRRQSSPGSSWVCEIALLAPKIAVMRPLSIGVERADNWARFQRAIAQFFVSRGFCEVSTPTLVVCPGLEPTLEPFATELHRGKARQTLFLPTSPELHLKKLLAAGWSEVFEIRSCFRNNELSPTHQPEFKMLEWYRAYVGLDRIGRDITELLLSLRSQGFIDGDLEAIEEVSVRQIFAELFDFKLAPDTTANDLARLANDFDQHIVGDDSWNDIFHRLWVSRVDPWLSEKSAPILVRDFPPSQAALARLTTEGWADRVELYWRGLEIANGFHELNDPIEQNRRFAEDMRERSRLGTIAVPIDEEFMKALQSGMPPCAGIALGVERLYMACKKIKSIAEVRPFPIL